MKLIISESQLNLIAEHLNLNEQSSTDYFGVADRYQKARGEELKPDNLNDPNARIIDWAGSSTMKIWNNGRAMLDDNNGNSWMGTMKITGNDSFKIIYDDGEVYRSATNDTVSADEDNMYVNCADSLDEIKDGSLKILKFGCKTDAVVELQKLLGMEEKYQTGYFGPITRKKVKAFQESKNLKADGIVGPKTYGVLSTNPVTATPTETTTPAQAAANTQAATANQTFMQGTSVENWIKDNGFRVTFSDADSTTFAFGDREMIHMEKDGTIQIWRMPVENEKSYVDHGTWTLNGEVINITLDDGFEYTSTSGKWTGSPKTAVRSVATQTTNTLNEGQFIRIKNLMKVIK